jgi:serine/threonine protein kinase
MELIQGITLEDLLEKQGVCRESDAVGWARQMCEILSYLHTRRKAIIHRDIKPSNIILRQDGRIALIDFGIAREFKTGKLQDTRGLGTKGYAAPEQYGFGESSPQTDLYSIGRILQECVDAFPKERIAEERIAEKQPSSPAKVTDPHTFDPVIRKCTQMAPSKRYSSAAALKNALLSCLGQSSRPDITGTVVNPYLPPGFRTLNPWKMLIASAVYLLVFNVSLTMPDETASAPVLWMERMLVLSLALINIAMGSNYLGIQQYMPFHDSSSRAMKVTGVLLTMAVVSVIIFVSMILMISTLTS